MLETALAVKQIIQQNKETEESVFSEEWKGLLSRYICGDQTVFARGVAKKLLFALCGSRAAYFATRDVCLYRLEMEKLSLLREGTTGFTGDMPYQMTVKLIESLQSMLDVAALRPHNWQLYLVQHHESIAPFSFLLEALFLLPEESVIFLAKLLALSFKPYKGSSSSSASSAATLSPSSSDTVDPFKEQVEKGLPSLVETLLADKDRVSRLVESFLLQSISSAVRQEIRNLLYLLWQQSSPHHRAALHTMLLSTNFSKIVPFGQNASQLIDLLAYIISKTSSHEEVGNTTQGMVLFFVACFIGTRSLSLFIDSFIGLFNFFVPSPLSP